MCCLPPTPSITRLTSKCKVVDGYIVWRIVHWKWQGIWRLERRAGTSLSEFMRGTDIFVALPTGYSMAKAIAKHVCLLAIFGGQGTAWWHCPDCITTCCYCEGPGSLAWRANGWHFAGYCDMTIVALHYITTNHWKVAQYVIQNVAHLIAFRWDSRTPRILGVASEYC